MRRKKGILALLLACLTVGFLFMKAQPHIPKEPLKNYLYDVTSWNHTDIIGRSHDDPYLIEYIKTQLHLPSNLPYNLNHPELEDFSQFNQTHEIKQVFLGKGQGFFIEAGALRGESYSNTLYWERKHGWTGLLIEPNLLDFETIKKKNRKSFGLNACLCPSNFANMTLFTISEWPGHGEIVEAEALNQPGLKIIQTPCYPLYSIIAAMGFPTVNLMSLDVEGWELDILKTVPFGSVEIQVLLVDYCFIKGGFIVLQKFLEANGYNTWKRLPIDGVFIKNGIHF